MINTLFVYIDYGPKRIITLKITSSTANDMAADLFHQHSVQKHS